MSVEEYLANLREEGVNPSLLDLASQVWRLLQQSTRLPEPSACPGERDNFMFAWRRGRHYLECEVFLDGRVEFFYSNGGRVWGEDTTLGELEHLVQCYLDLVEEDTDNVTTWEPCTSLEQVQDVVHLFTL